jgi:hypothetical protein
LPAIATFSQQDAGCADVIAGKPAPTGFPAYFSGLHGPASHHRHRPLYSTTRTPGLRWPRRSTTPAANGAFSTSRAIRSARTDRRRARQRQRFFAQPAAEKLKIDITQTRHHRGYGAIATEQLDPSKPSDLKETFDMGLHLPADHPEVLAENPCAARIAIRQCQAGKR